MQATLVMIVDDNPQNLTVLGEVLSVQGGYTVRAAASGARALQLAQQQPLPELILLDVMMPGLSGYDVLQDLRDNPLTRDIPVIFLTAMTSEEDEQRGLELGAVDYITKPLRSAIVLARVHTHLALRAARERLQRDKAMLEAEVQRRVGEQLVVQDVTIRALARLAETRDNETGNHIRRTQMYVEVLARRASSHPRFAAELDETSITLMAKSAPLHDIGKVGIPDQVLLKPGKLTAAEWRVMKTHAALGADAIERAEADAPHPVEFLRFAKQVARSHHERWNGSGYPDGLAGDAIPLAARLMALADVFDAMISRRVYKAPIALAEVHASMTEQRGQHFDPDLLDTFLAGWDTFCEIARQYPDDEADEAAAALPGVVAAAALNLAPAAPG